MADPQRAALRDRLNRFVARIGRGGGRSQRHRGRIASGLRAGGQLDVGLAEERLLAKDGLGVGGDRRVLRVDLDHGLSGVLAVHALVGRRQGNGLDLADRDAADADVGLLRELGRLGEVGRDLVALGLQRDRATERHPQEQDQAEARQREADCDQDAAK